MIDEVKWGYRLRGDGRWSCWLKEWFGVEERAFAWSEKAIRRKLYRFLKDYRQRVESRRIVQEYSRSRKMKEHA